MHAHEPLSYPSKKGFWIGLLLWGIVILSLLLSWYLSFKAGKSFDIKLLYIYLPLVLFLISIWFGTYYALHEDHLEIKVSIWYRKRIPYKNIRGIKRNRSFISAPALSADRLLIRFDSYDEILISPVDELDFVARIKKKNPAVRIDV